MVLVNAELHSMELDEFLFMTIIVYVVVTRFSTFYFKYIKFILKVRGMCQVVVVTIFRLSSYSFHFHIFSFFSSFRLHQIWSLPMNLFNFIVFSFQFKITFFNSCREWWIVVVVFIWCLSHASWLKDNLKSV